MGARAQVLTIIRVEGSNLVPFFVVHRQWAEGTDMLLEVLDVLSFIYSNRGYWSTEGLWDDIKKRLIEKFHILNNDVFVTDDLIKDFFDSELWRRLDNNVGFAILLIDMNKKGAFTGQLQLMNNDFTPTTINEWRDRFSYYDNSNDSDAFYSGFKILMGWYDVKLIENIRLF